MCFYLAVTFLLCTQSVGSHDWFRCYVSIFYVLYMQCLSVYVHVSMLSMLGTVNVALVHFVICAVT